MNFKPFRSIKTVMRCLSVKIDILKKEKLFQSKIARIALLIKFYCTYYLINQINLDKYCFFEKYLNFFTD